MTKIYDVSVPIRDGGLVYPGNPEIRISLQQSIALGAGANVSNVSFGSHTGTHVDAERHFFNDGRGVDQIPLETLIGPATLLEFGPETSAVGRADLAAHDLAGAERVLLKTRNSAYLTQDPTFHKDYTYLAPDGAEYLVGLGVKLVGIDYLSIEQFHSGHHRTHLTLLGAHVVIVEGLALQDVPAGRYSFYCLPIKLAGCDGAPARAVLVSE
ncbi:MAG TPA: cyclase family protein [Gemmatimonadaceae bacterium]|nr:cyclase family protein [Gemmatimonadaceae bacterium]